MSGIALRQFVVGLAFAALVPASALALNGPQGGPGAARGQDRPTPPAQAFTACQDKQAGDRVTVTTPRGDTLEATCREFDGRLAAIPDRPPRSQGSRERQ